MRPRETRHPVMIRATMRVGSGWNDVVIHNVSAHGMMLRAVNPPQPGTYIEIRKSSTLIVARAVWVHDGCFGIRAQDRIDFGVITGKTANIAGSCIATSSADNVTERKKIANSAERNRYLGKLMQFVCLIGAILFAAWICADAIYHTLVNPMDVIRGAMQP